jgi:hypothetical protein
LIFSLFGLSFVGLGCIGNDVYVRKWWVPLLGAGVVASTVIPNYMTHSRSLASDYYLSVTSLSLGLVVIAFHLLHTVSLIWPKLSWTGFGSMHRIRSLLASTTQGEMNVKSAGARKVHAMIHNALHVAKHKDRESVMKTHFSQALFNYSNYGVYKQEIVGGFFWTWRQMFSGKLFSREGVWYSTRLVASNVAQ